MSMLMKEGINQVNISIVTNLISIGVVVVVPLVEVKVRGSPLSREHKPVRRKLFFLFNSMINY